MGKYSFSGASSLIFKDVPPFVTVWGNKAQPYGLNKEGLRRHGFSNETIRALYQAYKVVYKQNLTTEQAIEVLKKDAISCSEINLFIAFLQQSQRGIVR
jgi:UDP-N-acetylglucosamine acyltransferase